MVGGQSPLHLLSGPGGLPVRPGPAGRVGGTLAAAGPDFRFADGGVAGGPWSWVNPAAGCCSTDLLAAVRVLPPDRA